MDTKLSKKGDGLVSPCAVSSLRGVGAVDGSLLGVTSAKFEYGAEMW